jgi:RNA polymerase sigma-70 factor (ECF subfamily)
VNTCRDVAERQRSRAHEALEADERVAVDADPVHEVGMAELREELRAELAALNHQHAQVVVLKDALGYSFEEIAAAAGMPVGTAKCYAHRGRNRLRERLGRREVA